MNPTPTIVIFFNDWKVFPNGVNAGGGETAIMALAKAIQKRGLRVIACANLPDGECNHNGIEFWNFGADYNLAQLDDRLAAIGPYYGLAATLVHPFILLRKHKNCLARILINHSPNPFASGLEPATVMNMIDRLACVSQAQRSQLMIRGVRPEKITVLKNGFDPEIFSYAGPEQRDWRQLVYIGRLEYAKGIHLAIEAYAKLTQRFPDLKLTVFGETSYWPGFSEKIPKLKSCLPRLSFEGKVPQSVLAQHLKTAGLLIFPSTCFESAGLAVVDAQASGCPVIGSSIGGVPEYLFNKKCGELLTDISVEGLETAIEKLLHQPETLKEMSRNCATLARNQTWDRCAEDYLRLAEEICLENQASYSRDNLKTLPEPCQRTIGWREVSEANVMTDHEIIGRAEVISLEEIEQYCKILSDYSAPFLWRGLILEKKGESNQAINCYQEALKRSEPSDWQPLFRITMLQAEKGNFLEAVNSAKLILQSCPSFQFASQLKQIIAKAEPQNTNLHVSL